MKKLIYLLIIILLSTISYAESINECKTDIYFGNGVWNKQFSQDNCVNDSAAECSRIELNKIIQKEIIKNDPILKAKYSEVKLQYNWGRGWEDVLEVYYQLREAGQVNHLEFFAAIAVLTGGNVPFSAVATASMLAKMPSIAKVEQANIDQMFTNYYLESLQWSHRVLLVSHSQGNLFANRIYDSLDPKEYQNYFANVQVASPASSVHAKMGKEHITNIGDMIINPIPGSMSGNVNPDRANRLNSNQINVCIGDLIKGNYDNAKECLKYVNHEFVPAYLGQSEPFEKILAEINYQLAALDQAKTQWKKIKDIGCLCKEKRIKVAHKFDEEASTIMADEEVFETLGSGCAKKA